MSEPSNLVRRALLSVGLAAGLLVACGGSTAEDSRGAANAGNGNVVQVAARAGNAPTGNAGADAAGSGSAAAGNTTAGSVGTGAMSSGGAASSECAGKGCGESCMHVFPCPPSANGNCLMLGQMGACDASGVCQVSQPPQCGGGAGGQGGTDFTACGPSDSCVITPNQGCGPMCEPVDVSGYVAVNSAMLAAYRKSLPILPCVSGGTCPVLTPNQFATPNYYASCTAGHCQVNDVRTTALSACTAAADCTVRAGTDCCGCGSTNWVAINAKANVEQVLCAPSSGCALDCVGSVIPTNVSAICNSNGHCALYENLPD